MMSQPSGPSPLAPPVKVIVVRSGCPGGRHYYVNQGGSWVCTMCGDTR